MVEGDLILNRYRPIELKGQGASGTVEICWDTRIQRRVAIKRMPIAESEGGATVVGLAEARTAALLSHPCIVNVYDFETSGNEAFLIMEAIEGPTLTQLIDADPDHMLSLDVVAAVTEAVGEALDFAHENQVLHLDIKPDNILIDMTGHVKVSDFGVSELADAQGFGVASGGTIGYMPPEQISGEDLDQRCDEFALAVVVYEMLTGLCPFLADSLDASLQLMERFEVEAPSAVRADVDTAIDEIVLCALDPMREARPETVWDFSNQLACYLGDAKEGVLELKELAAFDDEIEADGELSCANSAERAGGRLADKRRVPLAARVACCALCWLVAGAALVHTNAFDVGACMLAALAVGLVGALAPAPGGVVALALFGIACLVTSIAAAANGFSADLVSAGIVLGIAWLLSAVFMAWSCSRERRVLSAFGALAALAALVCALAAAGTGAVGTVPADMVWVIVSGVASACLVVICTFVQPRIRGEH